MSFLRSSQRALRAPEIEVLPDGRKRMTVFLDARSLQQVPGDLELPHGTEYDSDAPAGWTDLRLIRKILTDDLAPPGRDTRPMLQLTYEQLHPTDETQVGLNTVTKLEDGRQAIVAEFLQFSSAPAVAVTVGTTTAPGDAAAYLQSQEVTNNGTLRSIKRTYVYAGTISTDDQALNGGALLRKTIVSVKTVPATPAGYTLVGSPVQHPNGLPVYSYTYFKGDGETGRTSSTANGGKLERVVITHLTATSVTVQPTSDPLSGGVAIVTGRRDEAGHRVWEVTWVKGEGEVSRRSSDDAGGKLQRVVITHLTALAVMTQPTSDPLSGGVAIVTGVEDEAGHRIWEVTWVKGEGEIGRRTDERYNGMLQRVTITHLTATSVTTQPTSDPLSGGIKIAEDWRDDAGHRIWTAVWTKASGTALIRDETEKRNKGKLVIYRRSRFNTVPDAPSATIGGTVVEISSGSRLEDGFTIYDKTWAEGVGEIAASTSYRHQGKLVIYRKTALAAAPSAPAATIGGTVVLVQDDSRDADGITIYDLTWAEGKGVVSKRLQALQDGLRIETWVSLGGAYDDTFMLPAGILLEKDHEDIEGITRWTVSCVQNLAGASPLVGTTVAGFEMVSPGNTDYGSVPSVSITGGGGSGAAATAVLSGGSTGFVTGLTLTNAGSGYTSPPLVTIGTPNGDEPQFVAVLTGVAQRREVVVDFEYPGRAKAVDLAHPDVVSSHNLDVHLTPPVLAKLIGLEEISYRTSESLSDLTHPLWNPTEWATVFAQFLKGGDATPVSRVEGLRGYRTEGGVSAVNATYSGVGFTSVMGSPAAYVVGAKAYLKVFGGPDAPDDKTFTLGEPRIEPAFVGYDGTQYFKRRVVYAVIPPQAPLPTLTTVDMLATSISSTTGLKAVATASAAVGSRTNAFFYSWTQSGVLFTRFVRPTLVAGTLAGDTTFYIKPTDYAATTNEKYWVLT